MSKNQGVIRLSKGFRRVLSVSEKERGYIFVTKDQEFDQLKTSTFMLKVNGDKELSVILDKQGRLVGIKKLVDDIGENEFCIMLTGGVMHLDYKKASE